MTHLDPLRPHSHDNNVMPPHADPTVMLILSSGEQRRFSVQQLRDYPVTTIEYSYTTDHGKHGPYRLTGVALRDLIRPNCTAKWREVEVISADGFGNRLDADEVNAEPIMLCYQSDGTPLTREHGLVRLVVPSETDNALRQIKWVEQIRLV